MGRFFGKRPDPTDGMARAVRKHLEPGEQVIAGINLQSPGTLAAGMRGAASGAVAGALDVSPSFPGDDQETHKGWLQQAEAAGIDRKLANQSTKLALVLTTGRLLLFRRSRLTGRLRQALATWPVSRVDRIEVPRNGSTLSIHVTNVPLTLELPHAHRFLPDVYRKLPELLRRAQKQ